MQSILHHTVSTRKHNILDIHTRDNQVQNLIIKIKLQW